MKIKRILKWSVRAIWSALVLRSWSGSVAYWRSTNDCDRKAVAPANPMKAVTYCEYGSPDVLKLEEIEKPVPNDNEILVRVRAASLNAIDGQVLHGVSDRPADVRTSKTEEHAFRSRFRRRGRSSRQECH